MPACFHGQFFDSRMTSGEQRLNVDHENVTSIGNCEITGTENSHYLGKKGKS